LEEEDRDAESESPDLVVESLESLRLLSLPTLALTGGVYSIRIVKAELTGIQAKTIAAMATSIIKRWKTTGNLIILLGCCCILD
jgi:hypothetical protein